MCLYIGKNYKKQTKEMKLTIAKSKGKKYFWKAYDISTGRIISPFKYRSVNLNKDGYIDSDRISVDLESWEADDGVIHRGIHVYVSKKAAMDDLEEDCKSDIFTLFKVSAKSEDLVAVGKYGQAVFMKVRPADKKFDKYFKKNKR